MHVELSKTFRFEAAHRLPRLPATHKCARLHGHSFYVDIHVAGECDPELGWLLDFGELTGALRPVVDQLDHTYLNEIEGLENPTSENLAVWIWDRVAPSLVLLASVTVRETCNVACTYRGR